MNSAGGEPYYLYGDPSYGMDTHLTSSFQSATAEPLALVMREFNQRMSHCLVAVERGFKEMTGKWAFVDMKTPQKILLSPVDVHYEVANFLSNAHTCLNGGNEVSNYFNVLPPSLKKYLQLACCQRQTSLVCFV